jgi:hypothetical protein
MFLSEIVGENHIGDDRVATRANAWKERKVSRDIRHVLGEDRILETNHVLIKCLGHDVGEFCLTPFDPRLEDCDVVI